MKLFSVFLGLLALLCAALCLCALIGQNPTLPSTWGTLSLLERELVHRLPPLEALEGFWRALLYMTLAGVLAGLAAYLKPRTALPTAAHPRPRPAPGVATD